MSVQNFSFGIFMFTFKYYYLFLEMKKGIYHLKGEKSKYWSKFEWSIFFILRVFELVSKFILQYSYKFENCNISLMAHPFPAAHLLASSLSPLFKKTKLHVSLSWKRKSPKLGFCLPPAAASESTKNRGDPRDLSLQSLRLDCCPLRKEPGNHPRRLHGG